MQFKFVFLAVTAALLTVGTALAVQPGKTIEFTESPMGKVVFSGDIHKEAGISCKECHKDGLFPKMKKGTVKITMAEIYAQKLCGTCHNGQRAFAAMGNCNRCHVK